VLATVPQVIDWDGFAELEMVTLACVALRSVTISHCDSLLDATCTTFADGAHGGGLPGSQSSNWRCPDLRRAAQQSRPHWGVRVRARPGLGSRFGFELRASS